MQLNDDVTRVFMKVDVIFNKDKLDALKVFMQNNDSSLLKTGDSLEYSAQSNSIVVNSFGECTNQNGISNKKRLGYVYLSIDNIKTLVTM